MPISRDEFQRVDEDGPPVPDLSAETTQGTVYRFLVEHGDRAFRQREIVDRVDVPAGSVGPTLHRLERHGLVEHRDRFWAVADGSTESVVAPVDDGSSHGGEER
ncbi:helix-turn-helix transcriptional regulator [Halosimplex salinum]|uniref:helix-turn-helix transcriptional regulator n=1 Tax=Halosimplex salinum TaxID=1710538 RepID=UPI0019D27448|nr:MarR family transcriptional regulator [Halosimplex salinum]